MNKEKKERKAWSLYRRIVVLGIGPNIVGAATILFYSIFSVRIPSWQYMEALKFIIPMILGFEFLVSPIMNYIIFGGLSKMLDDYHAGRLSEKERMTLFKRLCKMPSAFGIEVLAFFFAGSVYIFGVYYFIIKMDTLITILCFLECFYGSCLVAGVSFAYSRLIVRKELYQIVKDGVNKEEALRIKTFGRTLIYQISIFIIFPIVYTGALAIYVVWMGYHPFNIQFQWISSRVQITRMISICILNLFAQSILVFIINRQVNNSNRVMMDTLEDLEGDLSSDRSIDTELYDEIAYNQYLANLLIDYLKGILRQTFQIGQATDNSANGLLEVAGETESTAVEQSTATNEIVSTMEDANILAKNIETKITEVSDIALQTAEDVQELYDILEKNLQKMAQIQSANEETILGINDVNEKMNSIWEIINIINSIADTTKIIAFNAELEATNVHEKGRNFKNVANEIRRLANGTMDSTKEIKDRIGDIQAATDKLKNLSANSTSQINDGMNLAHSLENSFTTINESASESADSSTEIKIKIGQETEAFKQILVTLQQISKGIESFSSSTHLVLDSAADLQNSVRELNKIGEENE